MNQSDYLLNQNSPQMMYPYYNHQFSSPTSFHNAIPNLPMMSGQFDPDFLQYSMSPNPSPNPNPNSNSYPNDINFLPHQPNSKRTREEEPSSDLLGDDVPPLELKRKIHIQSEKRRRAQIKGGFAELRDLLPPTPQKSLTTTGILTRSVAHLKHLHATQYALLAEVQRLRHENYQLQQLTSPLNTDGDTMNSLYSLNL